MTLLLPPTFKVIQKIELLEALTAYEGKNRYTIADKDGKPLYYAAEDTGYLNRRILGTWRPITLHIVALDKKPISKIKKTFGPYPRVSVYDSRGTLLFWSRKRHWWSWLSFNTFDADGSFLFSCIPKLTRHIWTYEIKKDGHLVAYIRKNWSNLVQEYFTDADNYTVDATKVSPEERIALLGSLFAIDLIRFEGRS